MRSKLLGAISALFVVSALVPTTASAALYVVNTNTDGAVGAGVECVTFGTAPPANTVCTLRAAIQRAMAHADASSSIELQTEGLVVTDGQLPTIYKSLTIIGATPNHNELPTHIARRTSVPALPITSRQYCYMTQDLPAVEYGLFRVGDQPGVSPGPEISVKLENLIACDGDLSDGAFGGALLVDRSDAAFVTLDDVRLVRNKAVFGGAVGVINAAHSVIIRNSSLSANEATGGELSIGGTDTQVAGAGGAVFISNTKVSPNTPATLNIIASTLGPWIATGDSVPNGLRQFIGNKASNNAAAAVGARDGKGGAVAVSEKSRLLMERSFVVANTAASGSAIRLASAFPSSLVASTIARNTNGGAAVTVGDGFAISNVVADGLPADDDFPFLGNIVAANSAAGCLNPTGTATSVAENGGYNVVDNSCLLTLHPLEGNTAPTLSIFWPATAGYTGYATRLLAPSVLPLVTKSPAIDRVRSVKILIGERSLDARGFALVDGNNNNEAIKDAGAYEFGANGLVGFDPPAGGFTVAEPATGNATAALSVRNYINKAASVEFKTLDIAQDGLAPGSALPDSGGVQRDYAPSVSTTIPFSSNTAAGPSVTIHSDTAVESDETVKLLLSASVNANLDAIDADLLATSGTDTEFCTPPGGTRKYPCVTENLKITDQGNTAGFRFDGPDVFKRTDLEDPGTRFVTVLRRGTPSGTAYVTCTAESGSAEQGRDFVLPTQVLEFLNGETTKACLYSIVDDSVVEANETFRILLKDSTTGTLLTPNVVDVTIQSDDVASVSDSVVSFTQAGYTGSEASGTVSVTLHREVVPGAQLPAASVLLATQDGTATSPAHYTATFTTVSWAAGDAADKIVAIPVKDDQLSNPSRSFTVKLTPSSANVLLATPEVTTVTLLDDETIAPVISASKTKVAVREGGATDSYQISVASAPQAAVNVTITTDPRVTVSPSTVTFSPSDFGPKTVTVTAVDNATIDGDRSVQIRNVISGQEVLVDADVLDNDSSIAFTAGSFAGNEHAGTINVTVRRTGSTFGTAQVLLTATPGTATAGADYTNPSGTVTFANGEVDKTVSIPVATDGQVEPAETFTLTLSAPAPGAGTQVTLGSPATATVTINDGDSAGIVINPTAVSITEGGSTGVAISLASPPLANVTVNLSAPLGLSLSNTVLSFTPANYATAQTVTVTSAQDSIAQGSRSLTVTAQTSSSDGNYVGRSGTLGVSVADDDAASAVFSTTPSTLTILGSGSTTEYTLKIGSVPTANITVAIATPAGLTLAPTTVTFNAGSNQLTRKITVIANENPGVGQTATRIIQHNVSTSDPAYASQTVPDVTVQVTGTSDDDDGDGGGSLGGTLLLPLAFAALLRRRSKR